MRLELKNIQKSFGEKVVLKGISFSANNGKAFGLLGRNVLRYEQKTGSLFRYL